MRVRSQVELPVIYESVRINVGYRIDLLVEETVVVELKSIDALTPLHEAQLITYLKLSDKPVGLLINFNTTHLKDGIQRKINHRKFVRGEVEIVSHPHTSPVPPIPPL